MQVNIDMFNVYRGKLDSLSDEGIIPSERDGISEISVTANGMDSDSFRCTVERTIRDESPIDTIYIVNREKPDVIIGYVELMYKENHFETFVNPYHRGLQPIVMFTLGESNGTNNTSRA